MVEAVEARVESVGLVEAGTKPAGVEATVEARVEAEAVQPMETMMKAAVDEKPALAEAKDAVAVGFSETGRIARPGVAGPTIP